MKNPQSKLSRRKFLLAVGAGSAAVATVALVADKNGEPSVKPDKTAREGQGYHVTDHIRNYYRTAKL